MSPIWQNSKCSSELWLHDWLILREVPEGLEEYCYRCGKTKLFTHKEPNEDYLSYHMRMTLKPYQTEYHLEYES